MKKLLFLLISCIIAVGTSIAQKNIELTGFYGYSFNSKANTYYGKYRVQDSPNYGGILSVELSPDMFVELMYNRTDTWMEYYYTAQPQRMDVSTEYYQLGGLRQFGPGQVKPFGVVTLGMARLNMKDTYGDYTSGDAFRFAATIGGGAKILLGDKLGIRLQARLGMPMELNGLWIGGGTGGASGGVTFRVPIVQFDLSAGLTLRLGN